VNPLSLVYGGIGAVRNAVYDAGWREAKRLAGPVVSVGNLAAGGTGKTPFVILLGALLAQRGIKMDVLSRGYGRRTRGVALVDPEGSAAEFGDEPLLIARRLGVPVVVGEDRFAAGLFAEKHLGPQLHLLDDGFQHRRLYRDFNIVLLAGGDASDQLLPVGRLREPLKALRRADAIVIEDDGSFPVEAESKLGWTIRRGVELPDPPPHPVVFCGIARSERFIEQLRAQGVVAAATRSFRDHHAYSEGDVRSLVALKEQSGSDGFVTTEKDEINLGSLKGALGRVAIARVTMELANADAAVEAMLNMVERRRLGS
jgi:tetraacyldisaccharide 4'-kinase